MSSKEELHHQQEPDVHYPAPVVNGENVSWRNVLSRIPNTQGKMAKASRRDLPKASCPGSPTAPTGPGIPEPGVNPDNG